MHSFLFSFLFSNNNNIIISQYLNGTMFLFFSRYLFLFFLCLLWHVPELKKGTLACVAAASRLRGRSTWQLHEFKHMRLRFCVLSFFSLLKSIRPFSSWRDKSYVANGPLQYIHTKYVHLSFIFGCFFFLADVSARRQSYSWAYVASQHK